MPYPATVSASVLRTLICLTLVLTGAPVLLYSAEREWQNAAGGEFGTDSNWLDDLVPGEFDTAVFDITGTYTVTFNSDEINESANIADGNVTFSLAPSRTYTITDIFTVGSVNTQSPTLTISGGEDSLLSVGEWVVGSESAAAAVTTTITGADTRVAVSGNFSSDPRGAGDLFVTRIENGAEMSIGGTLSFDFQSNITVSGSGSKLELSGRLQNTNGPSVLRVENGGLLEGADARIANRTSNITVVVTGTGSEWQNSAIWLGERPNDNKRATVLVTDGGTITTSGEIRTHTDNNGDDHRLVVAGTDSHWSVGNFYIAGRGPGQANPSYITGQTSLAVVDGGSTSATLMTIYPKGTVSGDGTITVTNAFGLYNYGGLVNPGVYAFSHTYNNDSGGTNTFSYADEIGTLTIDGNFTQGNLVTTEETFFGRLAIRIAGGVDGSDQLLVQGDIDLDGILQINPFGTPVLAVDDSFHILDWTGELSGTFSSITAFDPGDGLSWNFDNLYIDGTISVIPEPGMVALLIAAIAGLVTVRLRQQGRANSAH